MEKETKIAFVLGVALGAGPTVPLVDKLMELWDISHREMLEVTNKIRPEYLPVLMPGALTPKGGDE